MAERISVDSDYADALTEGNMLDLRRLLDFSEGECVGLHGPREVLRISLAKCGIDGTHYLRKDRHVGILDILRDLKCFRRPRSRCSKTFRAIEWLEQAKIPTMKPVCLIERSLFGLPLRAACIVSEVPGVSLYDRLLEFGRPGQRKNNPWPRTQLLYELGRFIWRFHQARLAWSDLSAKHILVEPAKDGGLGGRLWTFGLIDVENMTKHFNAAERKRQFHTVLESLRGTLTASDVLRVMLGYLAVDDIKTRDVRRSLLAKIFPNAQALVSRAADEQSLLRDFPDNRPLPEEEWFERDGAMTINVRFREMLNKLDLPSADQFLTFAAGSELYKPGMRGRYRYRLEIRDPSGHAVWLYLKRTSKPKLAEQLSRMRSGTVRHSSTWHERSMIKQLSMMRIPVPVVVAYGEKMFCGYERQAVLITEGIVGQPLEKFVPKHLARSAEDDELLKRREAIRQLARMIGRFHGAGYCHRDLYLSHVLLGFKKGKPLFYLIDLARCFKPRLFKRRWIVKDLASMNYSTPAIIGPTDRMRFLLTYLGVTVLNSDSRRLVRQIVKKTARIARHDKKHRRVTVERRHEDSSGN